MRQIFNEKILIIRGDGLLLSNISPFNLLYPITLSTSAARLSSLVHCSPSFMILATLSSVILRPSSYVFLRLLLLCFLRLSQFLPLPPFCFAVVYHPPVLIHPPYIGSPSSFGLPIGPPSFLAFTNSDLRLNLFSSLSHFGSAFESPSTLSPFDLIFCRPSVRLSIINPTDPPSSLVFQSYRLCSPFLFLIDSSLHDSLVNDSTCPPAPRQLSSEQLFC